MLMQYLVRLIAPGSPAYGNTIPFTREQSLEEVLASLQVGDIIFTKTNNSWYQLSRKFLHAHYDHVSVVINRHEGTPTYTQSSISRRPSSRNWS